MSEKLSKQELVSPSGFPHLSPKEAIAQKRMLAIIRKNFERSGYVPIETPLVERTSVLTAKSGGEIHSQIYGLRLLNPTEGAEDIKDLALRFDHTVPLARFIAENYSTLNFPFRRYVIGPVFRGERAKQGRYRQFTQADIDVVGENELSLLHDAEIVSVINDIFTELAIGSFTVRIGNRKILAGLLQSIGLADDKAIAEALGIIDRLEKVGATEVLSLLEGIGIAKEKAQHLLTTLTDDRPNKEMLASLQALDLNPLFAEGVTDLVKVIDAVQALKVPEENYQIDISIARGLDYYTGTVFETRVDEHPELGSVASGGRYEDLASTFTSKKLPGVGISIGVTRLLFLLIQEGLLSADTSTIAPVLVTTPAGLAQSSVYLNQARQLREAGIPTEVYLMEKPLGKQLQFAEKRGFKVAVVGKEDGVLLKNLKTGEEVSISGQDLVAEVLKMLG